ncbi:glycoside hydrolase family 97 catalytic domain-containing protein [Nonomuraea sp. K274]|uniref:Glycoside hydrolase family 97 catalytic domain-containing protein n=1 Tax=Nonomuraea cypriaca TaxID=1187855 RepID=A0A931EZ48_9ACTN|nr:glycoside hydrolase family 97 protein [Nonomuraea cypriaca]MBF8187177.1 glycoside hydrolase family 97 catalytic domain-containing protein [Nonomuraea cypriaca]
MPTAAVIRLSALLLLVLCIPALPALPAQAAAGSWKISGFPGGPAAELVLDAGNGALTLAVSRRGAQVLAPSPVGIVTEQADLSHKLHFSQRRDRAVTERYTTAAGKRLERSSVMRETTLSFTNAAGARLELIVRVSKDGVAYRYRLPEDYGAVLRETSAFTVEQDAAAWLARHRRDYENPFERHSAASAPTAEYMVPALFETGGGYLLIAESDLDGRYSGPRLAHERGTGDYRLLLWDERVQVSGPLATPWRVMIAGDLATVTESTLVDDLAQDSKVRDTSWIDPGPVLWTWLAGGREAGQSLDRQKEFVDYAAARGWPYVKVDAGWYFLKDQWDVTDPDWPTTSWIPRLVEYARGKGVEIMVWVHFRDLDTAEERARWLPTLHRWGVRGVKIDFMDAESQERLQWYDEILPATAENRLMVNFHGSTIPKGIQRTWPHVLTMEGVHGGEKRTLTTQHLTTLPFTRNIVGSMDYTPMAFHREGRPTSDAHELGLAVTYESGLQDLAGTVESYRARPEAERFLEQVPAAWDETRLLSGRPGDQVVLTRRDGDRWFVGAGVSGAARTLDVPLTMLRGRWLVEVVRDGPTGLVRERHLVDGPRGRLSVPVPAEGGYAAIACRWRPGITTCDR